MSSKKKNPVKEFFSAVVWTLRINFKVMPWLTAGRVTVASINQLDPLFSAYFYARLIDDFSKLLTNTSVDQSILQQNIIRIAIYYILYKIVAYGINNIGYYFERIVEFQYQMHYNSLLAEKLNSLNLSDIENPNFTDQLFRAKESLNDLKNHTNSVIGIIASVVRLVFTGIALIPILLLEVVLFILFAIPRFFTQAKMLRDEWAFFRSITEERRKSRENIDVLFNNSILPDIKLNNTFDFFQEKYFTYAKWLANEVEKRTRVRYSLGYFFVVVNYLVIGFAIFQLGQSYLLGNFSLGSLTFYLSMTFAFSDTVAYMLNMVSAVYESNIKFDDLRGILEMKTSLIDGKRNLPVLKNAPSIEFKEISFSYPNSEKKVLDGLNLSINPGDRIAIVGHNGAGKTTLIKTLLKLYSLQSGKILINGEDLDNIKIKSWYKNIGVLFQEYTNYHFLNVFDGVRIGNLDRKVSEKEVVKSLQDADAYDFVQSFPNGLQQSLNEKYKGGIRPSTGQWQKLAIARFLYRDVKVVVFDEPTSSIDAVSEAKIFNNIFEKLKDKTVIIVSHRFSTVRKADKIVVLDKGKIVEQGTHSELLKLDGLYAHSYKLQAEGYK
jgi:ABC-type multidrug transport system fused ATPase/permease subunit